MSLISQSLDLLIDRETLEYFKKRMWRKIRITEPEKAEKLVWVNKKFIFILNFLKIYKFGCFFYNKINGLIINNYC